jgi:hypothetical protein
MIHSGKQVFRRRCEAVRSKIANSLVGSDVALMAGPDSIVHGIVSGVKIEAGKPKLLVAGMPFDLDQVVVAMPPIISS